MFKERSARKLLDAAGSRSSSSLKNACADHMAPKDMTMTEPVKPTAKTKLDVTNIKGSVFRSRKVVQIAGNVEEDSTPMDFSVARDALVQRSKRNGHNAQVVNKVFLRKKKFERMEMESRRKSTMGLVLKPSWDLGDPLEGRPSNVYEKKFVQDIAPKKSFEDLP